MFTALIVLGGVAQAGGAAFGQDLIDATVRDGLSDQTFVLDRPAQAVLQVKLPASDDVQVSSSFR